MPHSHMIKFNESMILNSHAAFKVIYSYLCADDFGLDRTSYACGCHGLQSPHDHAADGPYRDPASFRDHRDPYHACHHAHVNRGAASRAGAHPHPHPSKQGYHRASIAPCDPRLPRRASCACVCAGPRHPHCRPFGTGATGDAGFCACRHHPSSSSPPCATRPQLPSSSHRQGRPSWGRRRRGPAPAA